MDCHNAVLVLGVNINRSAVKTTATLAILAFTQDLVSQSVFNVALACSLWLVPKAALVVLKDPLQSLAHRNVTHVQPAISVFLDLQRVLSALKESFP